MQNSDLWSWIGTHSTVLSILLNTVMIVIWLAYLNLFFATIRRSRSAVIHIGKAMERDSDARCIIANMGSDTVYVMAIVVELSCGGARFMAHVTDRVEDSDPMGGDIRDKTAQGPLKGGEVIDIGSFRRIGQRAARIMDEDIVLDDCDWIEVTIVVAAHQAHRLMGGYKRFDIRSRDGRLVFRSPDLLTRQIRNPLRRRRLARLCADEISVAAAP